MPLPGKTGNLENRKCGTFWTRNPGRGFLLAEIQGNPDLIYRLYDYHRVGTDGKERELHIDKALGAAGLHLSGEMKQPLQVLQIPKGCAATLPLQILRSTPAAAEYGAMPWVGTVSGEQAVLPDAAARSGLWDAGSGKRNPSSYFQRRLHLFPSGFGGSPAYGRTQFLELKG